MSKYDGFGATLGLENSLGTAFEMERSSESLREAMIPSHVRALMDMQESVRPLDLERIALGHLDGIGTSVAAHDLNLLGSAYESSLFESVREVMAPSHVRALMDMQESVRPLDLERAALGYLDGIGTSIAHDALITASCRAVSQVMREHSLVSTPWASMEDRLESALGQQIAWSASSTFRLAESLDSILPKPLRLDWQEHLVKSMVPSFDLLAAPSPGPVGLLAFMHEPELGASLTWRNEMASRPSIAALVPEAPRLRRVVIQAVIACAFCGETLVDHDQQLRWKGNRWRLEVTVIPMCATCGERTQDDGNYIADSLDRLLRSQLRLVARDGKSDGVPRGKGKLRLVTSDHSDEGDDATKHDHDDEDAFE